MAEETDESSSGSNPQRGGTNPGERTAARGTTAKGGTVAKGLGVLTTLGDFPDGATAGDVARAVGHPFSTTYRLLGTLVDTGFVTYDPAGKRYALGLAVFELGQRVAHARGFAGSALPVLSELTRRTGESSLVAVRDGAHTVTMHTVDGPQFRTTTDPGDRGPLHTSAIGKILLAQMDPAQRRALLESLDLTARTPHSLADAEALNAQLDEAALQGWVYQREEHDLGMNAIAVPVTTQSGITLASLALAAPLFRADRDALVSHVPTMQDAAARLAVLLPHP